MEVTIKSELKHSTLHDLIARQSALVPARPGKTRCKLLARHCFGDANFRLTPLLCSALSSDVRKSNELIYHQPRQKALYNR